MKAKFLTRFNALIGLILALFGFGCVSCVEYGVPPLVKYGSPYNTLEATGKVTDENAKPLENIRVRIKTKSGAEMHEIYTNADGEYATGMLGSSPYLDSIYIVASDTADIYAPDSVRVKLTYDRSGVAKDDYWNEGAASIYQDFQLKKK